MKDELIRNLINSELLEKNLLKKLSIGNIVDLIKKNDACSPKHEKRKIFLSL